MARDPRFGDYGRDWRFGGGERLPFTWSAAWEAAWMSVAGAAIAGVILAIIVWCVT
jgi:hypothetical protein